MNSLTSFPEGSIGLVQGASRGIGLGLVRALLENPRFSRVIATCRDPERAEALREIDDPTLEIHALDITNAGAIEALGQTLRDAGAQLNLAINAAGVLHGPDFGPEKKLEDLDPAAMRAVFTVNALGPALLLRALRPCMTSDGKAMFTAISARVGSIGDNRLGGWYSYRASKAALNQLLKTASIELKRRNGNVIVAALHPGTTDTGLSRPFQANVPEHKLFSVDQTVGYLLDVIDGLGSEDSGGFFAWDGKPIEW
ncbi:MAG: SDR family oxidoreductase [Wenzhouxiangellaceae bacterium]